MTHTYTEDDTATTYIRIYINDHMHLDNDTRTTLTSLFHDLFFGNGNTAVT